MTGTHDLYDPPPPPVKWETPPAGEKISWTQGDVLWLVAVCIGLLVGAGWAWAIEPALGVGVTIAGLFVILESWFSALTFMHRHPHQRPLGRGVIFLVALLPWAVGIGAAVALLLMLFWYSDRAG
jgi:hypothetical protein